MANVELTIEQITFEAMFVLVNELSLGNRINREYDAQFGIDGKKIGDSLSLRKPARFRVSDGPGLVIQDYIETQAPLVINQQKHIGLQFTSKEMKLDVDDFKKRVLGPQVPPLANSADREVAKLYKQVNNYVGVPGTTPTDIITYLNAGVQLDNNGVPQGQGLRNMVINPRMQATILNAQKGIFNPQSQISAQNEKGLMGKNTYGFDWYMDQNTSVETVGALGGTPLVDGAGQSGSTILLKSWTAAAATRLLAGNVIEFAGVYSVNPQSYESNGELAHFALAQDGVSDGSGGMTVTLVDPLVLDGPFQNVTGSPADGAAVSTFGSVDNSLANKNSPVGMAFHRDAFTMAMVDLQMPNGVNYGARISDDQLKAAIRIVSQYMIGTDQTPWRCDILFGVAKMRSELASRIQG